VENPLLCAECSRRFFPPWKARAADGGGECFICQGALSVLPALVKNALSQSDAFEWETFAVSSSFPRSMLVRENEVATSFLPGQYTSLKNSVNSSIAERIAKATGRKSDQRAQDASFEFDFISKKAVARPMQLYIHGHYIKLARGFCQSRWHCSECGGSGTRASARLRPSVAGGDGAEGCDSCNGSGMNYPSVEEEIGKILAPAFSATICTLHASGREDVDVRCLGTGRPFVAELASPKKRHADLHALEAEFEKNENVRAVRLRMVRKGFIDSVCNSHFEKEYEAIISADRALTENDAKKISAMSGTSLSQHTPTRVLARRTDMLRRRTIYKISAELVEGGKLRLRLLAEAGTYIKEFIHSDGGRTKPSVSSALGCRAQCDSLDVVAIHDYFLETVKD
jgi:tRNA pseudouridine synthase 10